MELGIPVVIAMNMMDLVAKSGAKIDIGKLKNTFGCEIIETSALKNKGVISSFCKYFVIIFFHFLSKAL